MPRKKPPSPSPPDKLQEIMDSVMEPEDTFRFSCNMCGNCCRCRSKPINVTGFDIFRLAQGLGITPKEIVNKYLRPEIGRDSKVPIFLLEERLDGSCKFLRKGSCTVQNFKPLVCAVYPLGRFYNSLNEKIYYMRRHIPIKCGGLNGKEWSLREWIESFGLDQWDVESIAWNKLLLTTISCIQQMTPANLIQKDFITFILNSMYLRYDTSKPYAEQADQHREAIKTLFWKQYHIKENL